LIAPSIFFLSKNNIFWSLSARCEIKKLELEWGKLKAIPLQAWTGPEGYRSLRLPGFKTIGT
jgi:hypothetical protein